ncbi:MAG: hypothetical protein IPI67_01275 [Myxococcales bacterium]|nr:hypothetical protein [Myxococcales bacterium]
MNDHQADFARAFVAMSYLLDRRGDELLSPLTDGSGTAAQLARALGQNERSARAVVLAREIARVVQALDARGLK